MGAAELVRTGDGSCTLAHALHGETYHSRSGAWTQALERYARACCIGELARAREHAARPLWVLDLGTGLGFNAAAACAAACGAARELRIVSFERDAGLLAQLDALALAGAPLAGAGEIWHAPLRAALARALNERAVPLARAQLFGAPHELELAWVPIELAGADPRAQLALVLGDARETIARLPREPLFDAVFFDPFSPAREPELWTVPVLREIAQRMRPHAWLSTYSAAFAVRLAARAAGLRVGRGPRVGTKAEGTLASRALAPPPLEPRVERRLARALARLVHAAGPAPAADALLDGIPGGSPP